LKQEPRRFLQLASAIGIGSAFAAAMADRAMASPQCDDLVCRHQEQCDEAIDERQFAVDPTSPIAIQSSKAARLRQW
jgi:hypothetical protein